jgi:hypothetical protein
VVQPPRGPTRRHKGVPYIVTDPDLCSEITNAWYPSMQEPCAGFNSDDDVLLKVRQMMELADEYGVADIQLHTAFLWVELPQLIADVFKLDEDEAISLMTEMARAGNNGQFRAFNSGQEIDFLDINYSSVARPFGMTSFIVTNPHAIPNLDHLAIDTDGDGLSDDTEFQESLQSSSGDSDGDGYSDLLELRQLNAGFDPRDASKPVRFCPSPERGDRDGDGLRDCDEKIVGTDLKIADSDRDRIPDGIEYWFGSDPTTHDTKKDVDVDQRFTEQEIKTHSSPTVSDPIIHSEYLYSYTVLGAKDQIDRSKCHRFNVSQVRLVTTKPTAGLGSIGYNEIIALFGEGLVDDPRDFGHFKAACIRGPLCRAGMRDRRRGANLRAERPSKRQDRAPAERLPRSRGTGGTPQGRAQRSERGSLCWRAGTVTRLSPLFLSAMKWREAMYNDSVTANPWPRALLTLVLLLAAAAGCTERDLNPIIDQPEEVVYDNKLKLTGEICTADPDQLEFPLKVLFVIDTSSSMDVSDTKRTTPTPRSVRRRSSTQPNRWDATER